LVRHELRYLAHFSEISVPAQVSVYLRILWYEQIWPTVNDNPRYALPGEQNGKYHEDERDLLHVGRFDQNVVMLIEHTFEAQVLTVTKTVFRLCRV